MNVAIIKYNAGNVLSVQYALNRLGMDSYVTDSCEEIVKADKVIFPGVGSAGPAMEYLRSRQLDKYISALTQPVLGICLGMQLLCKYSEEDDTNCLGIFDQNVKKIKGALKVPHTGWNNIASYKSVLFAGLRPNEYMYFVHSYCAGISAATIAETDYNDIFSAALQHNNFYGVQFHPERSGEAGALILKNFIQL